jgi:excisionase family DNA binding protein
LSAPLSAGGARFPSTTKLSGAVTMTRPTPRLPQFLTVRSLAEKLGVSTKTVGRWIERSELRVHRLGRQIRIAEEDAISFAAAR